jgi:aspartate racemase
MKNGLKSASISEKAFDLLMAAASKLIGDGAEVIIGGCSEVSIALNQNMLSIPFIDAIDLMALESVNLCYDIKTETISSIHEY